MILWDLTRENSDFMEFDLGKLGNWTMENGNLAGELSYLLQTLVS